MPIDYAEEFDRYEILASTMCSGPRCYLPAHGVILYSRIGRACLAGLFEGKSITPDECPQKLQNLEEDWERVKSDYLNALWPEEVTLPK